MPTDPPGHLSAAAKAAWTEQHLPDQETPSSLVVLEAMAVQMARARDAQARVDAEGIVIAGAKGEPVPHPGLAIERTAMAEVRKCADTRPRPRRH